VKRCPTCNQTFTDRNLSFCIDDGTPLVPVELPADEETKVSASSGRSGSGNESARIPEYEPPRAYVPPGSRLDQPKGRAWPWVLGIVALLLVVLVGMGIAAAVYLPRVLREASNRRDANVNVNRNDRSNTNQSDSNSNAPVLNGNENTSTDHSDLAPTEREVVLAQLTEIENEWTVANINADKKALDRILADDYVGEGANGKPHGKAEYLKTIERDTSIQKWEFQDLSVDLKGERASLSGIINLQVQNEMRSFKFTDKFVWRDGRWQAVGSEVDPISKN
jgi:Domain of unknown function (DUF4440)